MRVTVVGCGRWGSFLAWYADKLGHQVSLYGRDGSRHMEAFRRTRTNGLVTLPERVTLTARLPEDAEVYVISIGSQGLRALLAQHAQTFRGKPLVLCMKGLEIGTGKRLSVIAAEVLGAEQPVGVWIGPGHVQEFTRGVPNCMVIDSQDETLKNDLIDMFAGDLIRFYYGRDLIGNEVGAAAKNVVGIAAGALDGVHLGTLKGALMSRGTREVARLINALGGNELSAYGLCHLGDYEATIFSPYSHNRRFGECVVTGEPYDELAEGYYTVKALLDLEAQTGVELPISRAVYQVLYEKADAREAVDKLFRRSLKMEF
ncbi:MAG: NAD(P)H-dependent glycerol-3-phosphate dehydrogenase [Candidatus Limiplasma sp.]|nr:NAD(P)H-dependent glycerol-3-phosphate dehydrogenase [Candidatus Limiplasma sp.]